jgi:hypothetical protein
VEKDRIFSKFSCNAPVGVGEIEKFETTVGFKLPSDYAKFLQTSNGGEGFIGANAYLILWRLCDLTEMNRCYQVAEYAPGLFIFGSDGGGEAYAFDTRNSTMPIMSVPFVGMDLGLARPVAITFDDFLDVLSKI